MSCLPLFPGTFQCPTCSAGGRDLDALAACDSKIIPKNCDYENPRCEVNKYEFNRGYVRVNRLCTSKEMYETQIVQCRNYGNCPLRGYCTESECMATLPGVVPVWPLFILLY